jgi:hypothetical protein
MVGLLHRRSGRAAQLVGDRDTSAARGEAGLLPLPIYVPAIFAGRIASRAPAADAQAFVAAYHERGIDGAGALDTEASMRGDPYTAEYERQFTAAQPRNWRDLPLQRLWHRQPGGRLAGRRVGLQGCRRAARARREREPPATLLGDRFPRMSLS